MSGPDAAAAPGGRSLDTTRRAAFELAREVHLAHGLPFRRGRPVRVFRILFERGIAVDDGEGVPGFAFDAGDPAIRNPAIGAGGPTVRIPSGRPIAVARHFAAHCLAHDLRGDSACDRAPGVAAADGSRAGQARRETFADDFADCLLFPPALIDHYLRHYHLEDACAEMWLRETAARLQGPPRSLLRRLYAFGRLERRAFRALARALDT